MLDVDTLLFASAAARAGFLLIFLIACFISEARGAFRFWTASILGSAIGVLLIYNDPSYPYFSGTRGVVIYMILGISLSCVWAGGCAFFGREISKLRFAWMSLAPGVIYGCAHGLGASPDHVVMFTIMMLVGSTALAAQIFLFGSGRSYLPSQILVGSALATYCLALSVSVALIAVRVSAPALVEVSPMSDIGLALFIDQLMSVLTYVGLVAMSLEDAQARIKSLATTDPLTGLANRRGIESKTAALIALCSRARQPAAVLILDIDHFKSINDRYGHAAGDAVLKGFADRLSLHCRRSQDVAGRWGGEEFLALLSDMPLEEAIRFADKFRLSVSETPFSVGDIEILVTVSIGVALVDDHAAPLDHAVQKADEALYDAKRGGRNRVCSAALANTNPVNASRSPAVGRRRKGLGGVFASAKPGAKRQWKFARTQTAPSPSLPVVAPSVDSRGGSPR